MADKVKVPLGAVEETLLLPLYARAAETHKPDGMLADPIAVEIVEHLDYDFGRFAGIESLAGATLRTLVFDDWVRRFLRRHPNGTVVEIGTGLNTRYERVNNDRVHWFDIDLPDVIAIRRAFFADHPRRHMIGASVLTEAWTPTVLASQGPYLFVAEAVVAFFDQTQVRQVYSLLLEHFPGSQLILDTAGQAMLDAQDSSDILGTLTARMRWSCDDPRTPEQWHPDVTLAESIDFTDLPDSVWARLSPSYQRAMRDYAAANPERSKAYRINHYRLG